jgi:hypothetical protein
MLRISLTDITQNKLLVTEIYDALKYAESIIESMREPLMVLSSELKVMTANLINSILEHHNMVGLLTIETIPTPTDSRVQIVTIPEKKMAVIRFSWIRTDARVQSKKQELLAALKKDNVTIIGESQYPGYNAPWTPPWITRNEVLVEIV